MTYDVTLIPGDGIGPEITAQTVRVLEATGLRFNWDEELAGVAAVEATGTPLPDATVESIRKNGIALKGPLTTPVGTGFRSVNVGLRKALDLYEREKMAYIGQGLAEPTARKVAETMLRGALENVAGDDEPHGCMRVIASVACGPAAQSLHDEIVQRTQVFKQMMVDRFERAKEEGDLPAHIDAVGLTGVLVAWLQGISIQSNQGINRKDLERLVDTALSLWPSA